MLSSVLNFIHSFDLVIATADDTNFTSYCLAVTSRYSITITESEMMTEIYLFKVP